MKTKHDWEAGWYEEQDKPGILALNRIEYGDVAISQEAHFDWLRTRNPAGNAIIPVAREKGTGRVVGFVVGLPGRVSCSGQERLALFGMNALLARPYRGLRILVTIFWMGMEEGKKRGCAFGYTLPVPKSLRATPVVDGSVVTPVTLAVRPLDIVTLTKTHVNNRLSSWGVNLGWKIAGATIWREHRPAQDDPSLSIVEDTELDESYDRFWEEVKTKYDLMLIRDRAFLQWRFCDIPSRTYQVLSARQATDILGYVVLRQAEIRGTRCGLIADFLVVPGERGNQVGLRLLHEAIQRFRQAQLSLSSGLILSHTQEFSIMRRAGYLPCPPRFAPPQFNLAIRSFSEDTPTDALTRPEGWYISIADHDAA